MLMLCECITLSVALPSMQVWTSRWPSQDTARWRMETGRELSQGGRKQRMYWPRRTVCMITVPSWEKQSKKHVHHFFSLQRWIHWRMLLPEIQIQPCPALCWYWRWPPRLCVHTTPELVWDWVPQGCRPAYQKKLSGVLYCKINYLNQ